MGMDDEGYWNLKKKILDDNGAGTMLADSCLFIPILGLIDMENKTF